MENTSMSKVDVLDNRATNLLPSALPFPSNVAMCYPPQPPLSSPLADGNHGGQAASNYLVPPAMTSPSGCLTSQQMYPNYPSPYYRTMLAGSQQGSIGSYYGTMLPTGHHSSAFYGSFYNPGSSTVYPGGTQPTLTPINYYSPSIYMQNHESVWGNTNQSSSQSNQNKKSQEFENQTTHHLPSCSKSDSTTTQPPTAQDTNLQTEKQPTSQLSTNKPPAECPVSQDLDQSKEPEFMNSTVERSPSKPESVCSVEEETSEKDSDDESAEEEEDVEQENDTSSTYSSCYDDSYTSEDLLPIENDDILDNVPESFLNDTSFGEIEQAKQDLVDDDLQCLLCNNFDHLIPRLDIAERLEPVVGEQISKSSVLLCTQCDLMLERYLSLEKEVQTLQVQIQSMYQNNKQHMSNKGDAETIDFEQIPSCEDDPNMCLNSEFPVGELNSQSSMMEELKSVAQTERFQSALESAQQQTLPSQQEQVTDEVRVKKAVKFLTCDECGKPYSDNRSLQRHVKQSHRKRDKHQSESDKSRNGSAVPLHCDQCNRDFERRSHYAYHVRVHHGTREFKCQVCDKAFVNRAALTTHSRIHSGEKPFVCETCGRGFNVNSNLLAHIPKCTGQLPFKCDQCDKAFATRALQQIHLKTHQGEYAAKCETCGMGFTKKSYLTAHQRIHTKEKPYQCPICGKAFASLGNCNSHAKTHVDERKYVCEICGKKFARRQALDAHLNRHNGVKPYKCDVCDKSFHDPSNLTNHKKTHRDDS